MKKIYFIFILTFVIYGSIVDTGVVLAQRVEDNKFSGQVLRIATSTQTDTLQMFGTTTKKITSPQVESSVGRTSTGEEGKRLVQYRQSFSEVIEARDRFIQTGSSQDGIVFEERAKEYLKTTIEALIVRFQDMLNWIDANPSLADDVIKSTKRDLNAQIADLNRLYGFVDSMSYETIQKVTLEVRTKIVESQKTMQEIIVRVRKAQIEAIKNRILSILVVVEQRIVLYEKHGYDMAQAREMVQDIHSRLADTVDQPTVLVAYTKTKELLTHLTQALNN